MDNNISIESTQVESELKYDSFNDICEDMLNKDIQIYNNLIN